MPYGSTITVLGSPVAFGEAVPTLVAEMQRRGSVVFRQHEQVLCARKNIRNRFKAYNTLVRNSALWGQRHARCMRHYSSKPTTCNWITSDKCSTSTDNRGTTGPTGTNAAADGAPLSLSASDTVGTHGKSGGRGQVDDRMEKPTNYGGQKNGRKGFGASSTKADSTATLTLKEL